MGFLLAFWKPIAGIVAVVALAAAAMWAWSRFTEGYREEGRAEVRLEWEADTARRIALTTRITGLWDEQRQKTEAAQHEADKARSDAFKPVRERIRYLPAPVADLPVPAAAVGVLDAAVVASNAAPAGPAPVPVAPGPAPAADTTLGAVVEWVTVAAELYRACREQVTGWQTFYANLRAAQPQGEP